MSFKRQPCVNLRLKLRRDKPSSAAAVGRVRKRRTIPTNGYVLDSQESRSVVAYGTACQVAHYVESLAVDLRDRSDACRLVSNMSAGPPSIIFTM